jgi:predicted MFS family arabinose efflux permease
MGGFAFMTAGQNTLTSVLSAPQEQDRLPVLALLAMAMTGFIAILTETLPAGLLPQIAEGLNVSQSMAGQLVTLYAAGSLVAAIPITTFTQGWRRKPTFLTGIIGFLIFNSVTAMSTHYWLTLGARFMAGVAAGMAWAILAGYARRMVADDLKGRALAIAMVGTPVALSLGVPAGSFLGALVGWRMAFYGMSALTIGLILWVLLAVPDFPGQPLDQRTSLMKVFRTPGVKAVLVTIFAWMTAHNILYTYIAPFAGRAGAGERVDLLLLAFGLAALLGIWIIGLLVDRMLRLLVLTSLAIFSAVALLLMVFGMWPVMIVAAVILWGPSFGGAATLLVTASADAAGDGADLANAMNATVWNLAIALGGILGGLLLDHFGAGSFPWAMFPLILLALGTVTAASRHGFTPGPRSQN